MDECTEKSCVKCGALKSLDDYYVRRDKHQARCKACVLSQNTLYAQANPEVGRAARRRWGQRNPEMVRARNANWYQANKEWNVERVRRWRAANPEAWLALQASWRDREDRRIAARIKAAEWRAQNPDRMKEWLAENQDKLRANEGRRRARKMSAAVGKIDVRALWQDCAGVCGICGDPLSISVKYPDPLSRSLDHIIPLSRGGSHSQANLRWTHLVCNVRKGARLTE